jgi:hypothetical protein
MCAQHLGVADLALPVGICASKDSIGNWLTKESCSHRSAGEPRR